MRIISALLAFLLGVNCAFAAEKRVKLKSAKKTPAREILKPYQPFEWGDNVVDAIRKICAMQPVPAKKKFGTRNISCNEYVDLDVTNDEPLYIFGPEQNVSLLNYKGIGIQIGTGYIIKYSPVMIKNVEYEATLQFNSVSEGHGAYLYDTKKDKLPWMSQKGSIIYLPVILTSLRLTPLYKEKAAGEFKAVIDEFKIKYGRSFVKEVGNDKYVFYRDGIWLHVYDDGDIFYDGETYLKNTLAMYDNYYFKHMESEGVH